MNNYFLFIIPCSLSKQKIMSNNLILEKAIKFALRIVKLNRFLIDEKQEYVLSRQILLSGTHIAKFVKDANQAESKAVFIVDMQSALKKATETEYWLLLLKEGGYLDEKAYLSINDDCVELIKMLTKAVKTSKQNV